MVKKLISIVGITSSGKSDLAIRLAKHFNGEIVSADSRQIYRGMDWCTGKVIKDEQQLVKHHLIDILDTNQTYNLASFQKDAYKAIDGIIASNKVPFLVGGTGLYVRSVVEGFNLSDDQWNSESRAKLEKLSREELETELAKYGIVNIDKQKTTRHLVRMLEKAQSGKALVNPSTPKYEVLQIGIRWNREDIYKRIEQRLDARLPHIISEVENLLKSGTTKDFLDRMGLEAKLASDYILGKFQSYEQFRAELLKQERHFAKRQGTWFKKDTYTIWLDGDSDILPEAIRLVKNFLQVK